MTRQATLLLFQILGLLTPLFGQTKEEKIKSVREKFQIINSDTTYQTKTLTNEQFLEQMTDGGGELTGYFKNGQIKKIIELVGVSYCVRTFEYYFWDGELIFVYEKEEDFPYIDSIGALDFSKLELAFEGRYYFDSGVIIEVKTTGQKRIPDDDGIDTGKKFLATAKENIQLLQE